MINCSKLPVDETVRCLIGERYTDEIEELSALGVQCIPLKACSYLDDEISYHADILSFNLGNGSVLINKGSVGERDIKNIGYELIEISGIKSPYPNDVALNAALIKDKLICNTRSVDERIKDFCINNGIEIIHTNQGYARCNLCFVSENAVITEDNGLAYLLKNYQFDVLNISPGYFALSNSHYGFIGGACAKLSDSIMYFSGDLSSHPEYELISDFLNKYNVKPVFNSARPLRDFGGIVKL